MNASVPMEDLIRAAVARLEQELGIRVLSIAWRAATESPLSYHMMKFPDPYYTGREGA